MMPVIIHADATFATTTVFMTSHRTLGCVARDARTKNGHPPRICEGCGRPFEWRRKWARDWENVRWCSERCRRGAR
jgi:hypothetical protein